MPSRPSRSLREDGSSAVSAAYAQGLFMTFFFVLGLIHLLDSALGDRLNLVTAITPQPNLRVVQEIENYPMY